MRLNKDSSLLILLQLQLCFLTALALRVDSGKKASSNHENLYAEDHHNNYELLKQQESFNPGQAEGGGWRQTESTPSFDSNPPGNSWHVGDSSGYINVQENEPSRLSEGLGTSYNPGPNKFSQQSGYSVGNPGQQYDNFQGSSLNTAGDLIVGQGSVQRPVNPGGQQHAQNFNHVSFPVQAHISPGASQYSQVITAGIGSKKPSIGVSDKQDFAGQFSGPRPSQGKPQSPPFKQGQFIGQPKPSQFPPQHVFNQQQFQRFGGNQFPPKSAVRPPVHKSPIYSKPLIGPYKPEPQFVNRQPGIKPSHFVVNSSLKSGVPSSVFGSKIGVQPPHQISRSSGQGKY